MKAPPFEGDHYLRNGVFDFFPKLGRKDEKEAVVGKKRHDKNIDVEDARGEGEGPNEGEIVFDFQKGFRHGPLQTSAKETSRPMGIPRWVPLSTKGRSGQGQILRSSLMLSCLSGGLVGTTTDLCLFIPRPETSENLLMRVRAGQMSVTLGAVMARSSAKAKGRMVGNLER